MTSQQVEQQTRDLIKKIVSDEGARDMNITQRRKIIARLRDVSFEAEVAAQELEAAQ